MVHVQPHQPLQVHKASTLSVLNQFSCSGLSTYLSSQPQCILGDSANPVMHNVTVLRIFEPFQLVDVHRDAKVIQA